MFPYIAYMDPMGNVKLDSKKTWLINWVLTAKTGSFITIEFGTPRLVNKLGASH